MSDQEGSPSSDKILGIIGSPSDPFEVVMDITDDSAARKLMGELAYFSTMESGERVISLGQIIDIVTENKWHEEPSFKGIIKRYGSLPHLSGVADSRIAKLTVQSSFKRVDDGCNYAPHRLGNSPSTGIKVHKMTNEVLTKLVRGIGSEKTLEYLGNAYDTDVRIPFTFEHFGDSSVGGAGEAYHIGIFGRTGSGKTVTAAKMLEGYAGHAQHMSVLVLDPMRQFTKDQKVLGDGGGSFRNAIIRRGMKFQCVSIPEHVYLPEDPGLFAELLSTTQFVRRCFGLNAPERVELVAESIADYLYSRLEHRSGALAKSKGEKLLCDMLGRFASLDSDTEKDIGFSRYVSNVYSKPDMAKKLARKIEDVKGEVENGVRADLLADFDRVLSLFRWSEGKQSLNKIIEKVVDAPGNFIVMDLSSSGGGIKSDNVVAFLVRLICEKIVEKGDKLYESGRQSNCLVVMDEAGNYTNRSSSDPRIRELNQQIIRSVRTTRKYGIGFMFITQTIESMDDEILRQMRIFAFGYGLTMGKEFGQIRQIINDDSAARFYKSFIDPKSSGKYPFLFHGPISPLSFSGAPLFIEMN